MVLDGMQQEGARSEEKNRYKYGMKLLEQGRLKDAIVAFDEAIRLDPQHAMAYGKRGGTYSGLGQPERAIQDFDEAIRLNPKHGGTYIARMIAYTRLGKDEEAHQDFERAVRLGHDRSDLDLDIYIAKMGR